MNYSSLNLSGSRGFTLIEMMLVLSLASIVGSLTITNGITYYDHSLAAIDRAQMVTAFREARAEAQNGSNPYGVFLTNSGFVIFQGTSYGSRLDTYDRAFTFLTPEILSATSSLEAVFSASSADTQVADSSSLIFSVTGTDHRTELLQVLSEGSILTSTL
jgi:prepilin-type N-terminal cleavage/methylation domain-containing protein